MCHGKLGCQRVRHVDCILFHLGEIETIVINLHRTDGLGISGNGDAHFLQDFCSNGTCSHSSDGLAARRPPAAGVIPEAVFAVIGIICMPRTIVRSNFTVIFGTLGSVPHHQGNGGAGSASFKDAR